MKLVDIVKWALIVLGIGACVGGVVLHRFVCINIRDHLRHIVFWGSTNRMTGCRMRKEAAKKKTSSREELLGSPEELDPSRLNLSGGSSKLGPFLPRQVEAFEDFCCFCRLLVLGDEHSIQYLLENTVLLEGFEKL